MLGCNVNLYRSVNTCCSLMMIRLFYPCSPEFPSHAPTPQSMKKPNVLLLVFCLALLSPASAYAQSTWVGGFGGNVFNNASNWASGVPGPNADLIFTGPTGITNVSFNTLPYTANSLTFSGAY